MKFETLYFETSGQLSTITLNRPDKRNAISIPMIAELQAALDEIEKTHTRVVILTGTGKAFCAGIDLDYLQAIGQQSAAENQDDSRRIAKMFRKIWSYSRPMIAAVNGHALAGGCGIATLCDFTLAVPEAKFGYTEVAIGFVPAIVSIYLERVIGKAPAVDLLETGRIIEAHEAKALGLIHEVVSPENLEARAREFALGATKRSRAAVTPEELERACVANAQARFTEKCRAGVSAFLAKRQPR